MGRKWRIALLAALQTLLLAGILAERALILAHGREIVLTTEPVDPRDLFRGDYVTLNYEASRMDVGTLSGDNSFDARTNAYVIFKEENAKWRPVAIYRARPAQDKLGTDEVMLKAYIVDNYSTNHDTEKACPDGCEMEILSYGVESYFVPESTGPVLEEARNTERLDVIIAVRSDGRAAIKALRLDGRTFAQEGLF